jgi:hypothetical protein
MSVNFKEFEDRLIKALRDSGLIENFSFTEISKTPSLSLIIKLFETPSLIDFDDQGLFFFDEEGEKHYCPEMKTSISDKGEWLSEKLPQIGFDIDQNGNVRKADEAEAMYIVIQVAHILKEETFKNELEEVSKNYDFETMKSRIDGGTGFRELLKEWQTYQSVIINIIVSAAKFKISSEKKDTEKFLKDGIQESEVAELRNLEAKIRNINYKYSQGILSPDKVKNLTKIERLQEIDKRDDEISKSIINSPVGNLFRSLNLSSEYISPNKKKKISLWVQVEVDKLLSEKEFNGIQEERASLISKFVKRAYRFEKISVRKNAVERYISNREDFKLPSKL